MFGSDVSIRTLEHHFSEKLFFEFIENSVDSVKFLAYNDIEAESLLRNLRSVMHNTKGGMPT